MENIEAKPGTYAVNDNPSPHGVVSTIVYFFDADGHPCVESDAVTMQILEFDADGVCIFSLISGPQAHRLSSLSSHIDVECSP